MTSTRRTRVRSSASLGLGLGLGLGVALAFAAGLPAQDQDKRLLRYKFTKGDVRHYRLDLAGDNQMKMNGRDMSTRIDGQFFLTLEVLDVQDGTATMAHTITRIVMKMTNPMIGNIEFDSDDEDAKAGMMERVLDMVGQTMKAKVDARGKASGVELPPAMQSAGGAGINLEDMLGQVSVVLPEEPIAVGDTWKTSVAAGGQMGEMKIDVDNKLVAADGDLVSIAQVMKIEPPAAGPMKLTMKDASGQVSLDLTHGIPASAKTTMEMEMSSEGPMAVEGAMKMAMSIAATEPPPAKAGDKAGAEKTGEGKDAGAAPPAGGGAAAEAGAKKNG